MASVRTDLSRRLRWLALFAAPWTVAAAPAAPDAATLASDRGCFACHGPVRKQVGPGFAQVAERYRGDAGAAARLAAKIRSGSVGSWGRVIMPRQGQVSEAEASALAAWVLAQPGTPPAR